MESYELAQASFQLIPLHRIVSVARHHHPCTQVYLRGSTHPNQECVRSERLPL